MPNDTIGCSQRLQRSDELDMLKNDDKKPRGDGHTRHTEHQNDDDPYIQVQQFQPRKELRISLIDIPRHQYVALMVGLAVYLMYNGL